MKKISKRKNMYHEDRWENQNDASGSDVISESLEIWVK